MGAAASMQVSEEKQAAMEETKALLSGARARGTHRLSALKSNIP